MSILTVAQGIEKVIKKLPSFDSQNVAIGNFIVLDTGTRRAVIIEYQPSTHGISDPPARHGQYISTHSFTINVNRAYEEDGTSYEDLLSDVSDIKAELDKYRKLDGTDGVLRALVTNSDGVQARFDTSGNGPHFIFINLSLEVKETTTPNYEE